MSKVSLLLWFFQSDRRGYTMSIQLPYLQVYLDRLWQEIKSQRGNRLSYLLGRILMRWGKFCMCL